MHYSLRNSENVCDKTNHKQWLHTLLASNKTLSHAQYGITALLQFVQKDGSLNLVGADFTSVLAMIANTDIHR